MRIGYDAKRLFHNHTGLGNYSRTLLTNLSRAYPDNEYFLYTPRRASNNLTKPFLKGDAFHTRVMQKGVGSLWRTFSMSKDLKRDKLDIYHGLSNELPIPIRKTGIRAVVTIHDLIFKRYPATYAMIDRKIYDIKFRDACRKADQVIAISKSTRDDLRLFYRVPEERVRVIYQSCHPVYYRPQSAEEASARIGPLSLPKEYLLYVGSVIERKNLAGIVRAMSMLPPESTPPLVVVGKGSGYRKKVLQLIDRLDLDKQIRWLDEVLDPLSLQALYQCAAIFIYPSLYEGFGIPVAESLLSGTPVITSSVSSMPEAGGPHAFYVDPKEPEDIATRITELLSDSDLCRQRARKGSHWAAEKFDPGRLSRQMMDCYRTVISA